MRYKFLKVEGMSRFVEDRRSQMSDLFDRLPDSAGCPKLSSFQLTDEHSGIAVISYDSNSFAVVGSLPEWAKSVTDVSSPIL